MSINVNVIFTEQPCILGIRQKPELLNVRLELWSVVGPKGQSGVSQSSSLNVTNALTYFALFWAIIVTSRISQQRKTSNFTQSAPWGGEVVIQPLSSSQLYHVGKEHPQLVSEHRLYYEDFPSDINEIQETMHDVCLSSLFKHYLLPYCITLQLKVHDHE